MSPDDEIVFSLREGMELRATEEGGLSLESRSFSVPLPALPPGLVQALGRLGAGGMSETALLDLAVAKDGDLAIMPFYQVMFQLGATGALRRTLQAESGPIATLVPQTDQLSFRPGAASPEVRHVLSRFAYLHREGDGMVIESPLGHARLLLHDPRAAAFAAALSSLSTAAEAARVAGLSAELGLSLLGFLVNAGAAVAEGEELDAQTDAGKSPLAAWEMHDLVFHARSRLGRHDHAYGGTFHMKGKFPPPPLVKPLENVAIPEGRSAAIPLERADIESLLTSDTPFTAVLERRRSVRDYSEEPISARQLGELLFRAARIQKVIRGPEWEMEHSLRPSPGGGAIHELEIYPVVAQCEGIEPGVYRYDPLDHCLRFVATSGDETGELLEMAWRTGDRKSRPQVYLGITARFQRFQWKYQSMAYAAILKDVGALYQTVYLVATAMGLAPCALGGGDSELFGRVAKLDYYAESQVGEMLIGRRKA